MNDGMSNLDSYLTQSDDVLRDPRVTEDRIRSDALGTLDMGDAVQLYFSSPLPPGQELFHPEREEIVLTLRSVTALPNIPGTWIVETEELMTPLLVPNDEKIWFDFA